MTKTRIRKGGGGSGLNHPGNNSKSTASSSAFNDASSPSPDDEYHNHATPCSQIVEQICVDMFPEFFNQPNHENIEHQPTSANRAHPTTKWKLNQSEDALTLDQVIRYYLLEKRRTEQVDIYQHRQPDTITDKNDEPMTLSKKRRKKKKKKKESDSQLLQNLDFSANLNDTIDISQQNSDRIEPMDELYPLKENPNHHHQHQSFQEFQIDAMLDHVLSKQKKYASSSSSATWDTSGSEWISEINNNQKDILISQSRQLESFLQYLHQRFDTYYQQQQHQQQPTCRKIKGTRNHNHHPPNQHVTSTNTSVNLHSPDGKSLNEIDHTSVGCEQDTASIIYSQEFIPTIRLSDISSVCNRIKCSACKKSAIEYIRILTMINSGTTTGSGGGSSNNSGGTSPTSSSSSISSSSRSSSATPVVKSQDRCTIIENDDSSWIQHRHTIVEPVSKDSCVIIDSTSIQVDDEIWRRGGLQLPMSTWNAFINEYSMDEQQHALDYTALEEGDLWMMGHDTTTTNSNSSNPESTNDDSFRLVLQLFESDESNKNGKILQLIPHVQDAYTSHSGDNARRRIFPLSLTEFDKWIRTVIIPCGLKELEQYNDDAKLLASNTVLDPCLSKEDFYKLASQVHSLSIYLGDKFSSLDQALDGARSMIQQVEYELSLGPICPSASQTLELADTKCMDYFLVIEKFFYSLHRETMDARIVSNGYKLWIEDIVKRLWEAFDDAMYQLIPIITVYLRKLVNLPCRIGSIPTTCNDPLRREYYFEMLSAKLSVIVSLHRKMEAVLRPPSILASAHHRSELVRIATVSSLCSHLRAYAKNEMKRDVHDKYHDLLSHHTATIFDTIQHSNTHDILKELRVKCQGLRDAAVSLGGKLVVYDEFHVQEVPEQFKLQWNEYLICFDLQKDWLCESDSFLLEGKGLEYLLMMSMNVNRLYRVKDLIDSYNITSGETNGMPPEFPSLAVSNINNILTALISFLENTGNHHSSKWNCQVFCRGEGGRRRVFCTISAFLYQWFSLRFSEFHAEVTQSELLRTITYDPTSTNTAVNVEGGEHQCKKPNQKKHKKKTPQKTRDSNCDVIDDEYSHDIVGPDESKYDDTANEESNTCASKYDSNHTTQMNDDENDVHESSTLIINYDGCVGVTDGEIFITARDYLLARYDEILLSSHYVIHL